MKRILTFIFPLAVLFSACIQEEFQNNQADSSSGRIFTAAFDHEESRTYIEDGNLLRWNAGDQISIFEGNTLNRQYQFDGENGDNSGTFSIVNKPFGTGNDLDRHYAVYPYVSDTRISENGEITLDIPATQNYAPNSFGPGANTMVAVTKDIDDTFLKFRNVCGYLKLQLYGDDVTVKSITLKGNNNEKIAGKASVIPSLSSEPTVSLTDGAEKAITLDCGEGVSIGRTAETATEFWIVVPPLTFTNGFEVTVISLDGDAFTQSTYKEISIERNKVQPMSPFEVNMDSLLLPNGSTFNAAVGSYMENNFSLRKLRFVTGSQNSSGSMLFTDSDGTPAYIITDGDWMEIHTPANSFRADADCSYMFAGYDSNDNYSNLGDLTEIDFGKSFNTSNVEDMSHMFHECYCITSLDVSQFNTASVRNMRYMFSYCPSLATLNISGFNTRNVTDMNSMFAGCQSLIGLDISSFNTDNVTDMGRMFYSCQSLTGLDISSFNTDNVTDMGRMFSECSSLNSLDVSGFNTANVTDMSGMFNNCSSLTELDIDMFETAKVTDMSRMFYYCYELCTLDVSHFNTSNVKNFSYMFCGCPKLETLDVGGFDGSNISGMAGMFNGCSSLSGLDLLNFSYDAYPEVSTMFNSVGSGAEAKPIPIKVTKEGYIYFTQMTSNCGIDPAYAKFVNADGSDCDYEEDTRIYNGKTKAVKPVQDENNVYLIQSAGNLKWFKENCEGEYNKAHYRLTTDILSTGISWTPVWFYGVFDGDNHIIENLNFNGYENLGYGFFRSLGGTVKNLILKRPKISQTGDNDGYGMYSGLFAAQSSGSIINCGVIGGSVSVSSTSKAWANGGGLVGCLHTGAVVKGCFVYGTTINGSHTRNGTYIGGLVGECNDNGKNISITSCYTKNIKITGNSGCSIGSFIGDSKNANVNISTCYYDSSVDAVGSSYSSGNIIMNTFDAITESNFTEAITKMNANLTDCDYIFGDDGYFVKR